MRVKGECPLCRKSSLFYWTDTGICLTCYPVAKREAVERDMFMRLREAELIPRGLVFEAGEDMLK